MKERNDMKKLIGLTLLVALAAGFVHAQTTVTNRGEVITVYTMTDVPKSTETNTAVTAEVWNVDVANNASVGGALTVAGTAQVDGVVTSGKTGSNGGIVVKSTGAGATTFSVAGATGNTAVGGTLAVTGASTLASAGVTGNATVGGTLAVTGVATFTAAPKLTAVTAEGSEVATMTNAPAAGNPVAWANVTVGTNTYVIPLFAAE